MTKTGGPRPRVPPGAAALQVGLGVVSLALASCVEHGSEPPAAHEAAEAVFELVASIPPEGATSPNFHLISGVVLGPTEAEIYVLDQFRNSVRVFNFEGNLIREFGGEGDGPGQFATSYSLRIVGDRLHVGDLATSRISWFDWEGGYLGSRTSAAHYPDPDGQTVRRSHAVALMRYDQVMGYDGGEPSRRTLLLLDDGDAVVDTLFSFRSGGTYYRRRSRPERLMHMRQVPNVGVQAYWTPIGDSLIASMDLVRGTIRWYRVDQGSVSVVRRREIGLTPRPVSLTEAEVRAQAVEAFNLPSGEIIEVDLPEFEATLSSTSFGNASTGDVWVMRRNGEFQPDSLVQRWFRVPLDESSPVVELETPRNFSLRSVADDLLLGVHTDELTEAQSVRVYRWRHAER